MKNLKQFIAEAKNEFEPATKMIKSIKGFKSWGGDMLNGMYVMGVQTEDTDYRFLFDISKYKRSEIIVQDFTSDKKKSIKLNITQLRSGTIEFAKAVAKMSGNADDYDVIVGRLNGKA